MTQIQQKLTDILKNRLEIAKRWTEEKYIDPTKTAIDDYEFKEEPKYVAGNVADQKPEIKRYEFPTPLIFTNTEAYKTALFDRPLDLMVKTEGPMDIGKKEVVEATYQYLYKKLDLESFQVDAAHWFILTGFVSAFTGYKREGSEVEILNEDGTPATGLDGQPLTRIDFTYDDPTLTLCDPLCTYYSPESKNSQGNDELPYVIYKKTMTKESVKAIYGVDVEPTQVVGDPKTDKEEQKEELKRCEVYFYYGTLPSNLDQESLAELEQYGTWTENQTYFVVFSGDKKLFCEAVKKTPVEVTRWNGNPSSFFGFGTGKIGRPFQLEKKTRRGQEIRMADIAAFPKLAIPTGVDVDEMALLDPRLLPIVKYSGSQPNQKPEYLNPPTISPSVAQGIERVDQDSQQAFGLMNISTGGQNASVVKTATGQSIFADAAERRVRYAKKKFVAWYKKIVISLLELARDNWTKEKEMKIMDQDGNFKTIPVSGETLKSIDFETDVDIDAESAGANRDVERSQALEMMKIFANDPYVKQDEIRKYVMRTAFGQKDPSKFIYSEEEVAQMQQPVDPMADPMADPAADPMAQVDPTL